MPSFLTTHTGSLPRPEGLTELLHAREDAQAPPQLEQRVQDAVNDAVRRQVEAGVSVVNDGEMGKIGYSTYVKDRLTGFERTNENTRRPPADLADFPDLDNYRRPTSSAVRYAFNAICSGDVRAKDTSAVAADIATLKSAATAAGAAELFMSAASPGV